VTTYTIYHINNVTQMLTRSVYLTQLADCRKTLP